MGVATPLVDVVTGYRGLLDLLPAVIERHPNAVVVRNQVGNLSILTQDDAEGSPIRYIGYINVRTGELEMNET